jgi:hypothetical protein
MTRRLGALILASGLMDLTTYLFFYTASVVALRDHRFAVEQTLLLGVVYNVVYSGACMGTAGWSEGKARSRFLIAGGAVATGAMLLARFVPHVGGLVAALAIHGVALSLWWPNLQARLGDLAVTRDALQRHLGAFNLSWTVGKGIGFFSAAAIVAWMDAGWALVIAAALAFGAAVIGSFGAGGEVPPRPEAREAPEVQGGGSGFLLAGRLANFVWWGVGGVLAWSMASRAAALLGEEAGVRVGAVVLATAYCTQAVATTGLWLSRRWRYRRWPLLLLQSLGVAGLLGLTLGEDPFWFYAGAVAAGVALGIAYYSSILYSLDAPKARARTSAAHEAVLAAGGVAIPLSGAALAWATGWVAAPFAFAAALALAVLPVQAWLARPKPVAAAAAG